MKAKERNLALLVVTLLAMGINFNAFLMGSNPGLLGVAATIGYIAIWVLFIVQARHHSNALVFSVVWSFATLVCASTALAVNLYNELQVGFAIPFVIIFITPLYGIEAFFRQRDFLLASTALVIMSFVWFTASLVLRMCLKRK